MQKGKDKTDKANKIDKIQKNYLQFIINPSPTIISLSKHLLFHRYT